MGNWLNNSVLSHLFSVLSHLFPSCRTISLLFFNPVTLDITLHSYILISPNRKTWKFIAQDDHFWLWPRTGPLPFCKIVRGIIWLWLEERPLRPGLLRNRDTVIVEVRQGLLHLYHFHIVQIQFTNVHGIVLQVATEANCLHVTLLPWCPLKCSCWNLHLSYRGALG